MINDVVGPLRYSAVEAAVKASGLFYQACYRHACILNLLTA